MADRHYPTGNSTQDVRILAEKLWNAIENLQPGSGTAGPTTRLAGGGSVGSDTGFFQPVLSVFGRIGSVTAQAGDYDVSQVTGAAPIDSPTFIGTPNTTTPPVNDDSTRIMDTAWYWNQPENLTRVEVNDSNYTATGTNGMLVVITAITAPRTLTLPPATTKGQIMRVIDQSGDCGVGREIFGATVGGDTIEGVVTGARLAFPYAGATLMSDGAGKWIVQDTSLGALSSSKFGIQCSVVDAAETVTVNATYQRHIIDTFTVYGTEIVNGVTYTFGLR